MPVHSQERKQSCMCVRGIDFASASSIFLLDTFFKKHKMTKIFWICLFFLFILFLPVTQNLFTTSGCDSTNRSHTCILLYNGSWWSHFIAIQLYHKISQCRRQYWVEKLGGAFKFFFISTSISLFTGGTFFKYKSEHISWIS